MGKEIEHKFLLADESWRAGVVRSRRMSQAYLASTADASIRVRIAGQDAWLNIKGGGLTAERDEFEYAIPLDDATQLFDKLAMRPFIDKTRHWVPYEGFDWEIDEFHGANAGLIVAEIELASVGQTFAKPPWIGVEVTQLARYYNVNLRKSPFSSWTAQERSP